MNTTTKIVREAMRIVSFDVRKPKCVRDGIVKEIDNKEMKNPSELTNEESTKIFEEAKPFLNKINVTGSTTKDERLKLFFAARFIDVRCRVDGHEYFFEGEEIRSYIRELQKEIDVLNKK